MKKLQIFSLILGLILLVLLVYFSNASEVWKVILNSNKILLLFGFLAFSPILLARTARWKILVNEEISFKKIYHILAVGTLFNNLLPSKLGGLIKAILLTKEKNHRLGSSLASVLLDNIIEIFFILITSFIIIFFFITEKSNGITNSLIITSILLLGLIIGPLFLYYFLRNKEILNILLKYEKIRSLNKKYGKGFMKDLRSYMKFLTINKFLLGFLWTFVTSLIIAVSSYSIILSLNQEVGFVFVYLVSTLPFVIGIASLIPGGFGVQDASAVGILTLIGVPLSTATSIALLMRFTNYFWSVLLGIYSGLIIGFNKIKSKDI